MFLSMRKHNKINTQLFFVLVYLFLFNPLNVFSHARDQLRPISTNELIDLNK